MSGKNCKSCAFFPKSGFTSSLFKLLTVLKQLHGTRGGARGSTLEDIAMFMVKYYCLDGDVKSQILATLKYAVKLNFIQKRNEKFSLVLPAASLQLAPMKYKLDEIERIQCIFPVAWSSISFSEGSDKSGNKTCKRKTNSVSPCCDEEQSTLEDSDNNSCKCKKKKLKKPLCSQDDNSENVEIKNKCNPCAIKKRKVRKKPCFTARPAACSRRKTKKSCSKETPFDNYCLMCPSSTNGDDFCSNSCTKCTF